MSKVTILDDLLRLGVRESCESPSLRLTKYLEIGDNTKAAEVNAVVACSNKYVPQHVKETSLFTIPKQNGMDGVTIVATLKSRLIVNQAGGILENAGLCLHRHFGYPYIPGSAVKGLARHAAWCEWKAEEDEDKKLEIAKKIADVFGYPTGDAKPKKNPSNRLYLDDYLKEIEPEIKDCSGSICFMSAEPVGRAPLVMDIVNCHHPKYYQGEQTEATDTENPIPNFFPAVEKGVQFQFQLMPLRNSSDGNLDFAKKWLVEAITIYGIGAKTAAGYGWFEDNTEKYLEDEKRQQEIANKQQREKELLEEVAILEQSAGELLTVEQVECYRCLKEKAKGIDNQQIIDALNKLAKKMPQESEEDKIRNRWNSLKNRDGILKDDLVKNFHKKDQAKRDAVAQLFRTDFNDIYKKILSGVKGFSGDAQKAIRDAVQGGGK